MSNQSLSDRYPYRFKSMVAHIDLTDKIKWCYESIDDGEYAFTTTLDAHGLFMFSHEEDLIAFRLKFL